MDIDVSKVSVGDIIPTEGGWLVKVVVVDAMDDFQPLKCQFISSHDGSEDSVWYYADGKINIEASHPSYKEYRLLHQWRYYPPEQRPQVGWKLLRADGRIVEVSEDDVDDCTPFCIEGVWYKYKSGELICCIDAPELEIINNIRYIGE